MYDKRVFGLFIVFAVAACFRPAPLRAGNTLDFFFPEFGDPTTIFDDMAVVKPVRWESDSEPISFVIFKPSSGTWVLPLLLNLNGIEDFEILEAVSRALGQWKNGPAWSDGPRHSLKISNDPIFSFQLSGTRPSDIALDGINLVIVGGESGPDFRPMALSWVRNIRDQCVEADVTFHYKQGAGRKPGMNRVLDRRTWDELPRQAVRV